MNRRSLYAIDIDINKLDGDETELTVWGVTDLAACSDTKHLYADVSPAEVLKAAQHVAGVIGRAATFLMSQYRKECTSMTHSDTLLTPASDLSNQPAFYIVVTDDRVTEWTKRIREVLQRIAGDYATQLQPPEPQPDTRTLMPGWLKEARTSPARLLALAAETGESETRQTTPGDPHDVTPTGASDDAPVDDDRPDCDDCDRLIAFDRGVRCALHRQVS